MLTFVSFAFFQQEEYFKCDKECLIQLDNDECDTCFVDEDDKEDVMPVYCDNGELTHSCCRKCCDGVSHPSSGGNQYYGNKEFVDDYNEDGSMWDLTEIHGGVSDCNYYMNQKQNTLIPMIVIHLYTDFHVLCFLSGLFQV